MNPLRRLTEIETTVEIEENGLKLEAVLGRPHGATGLVIFAHGSGSGRFSPRNHEVARALQDAGFATLLMDLLTEEEAASRASVFDIPLLAGRLLMAKRWLWTVPATAGLSVGYFGASTGAAAALTAAAEDPGDVFAVVSRGGRPDLADEALPRVKAPTLLMVGERDEDVLELNRTAFERLNAVKELTVIPGATHLFEEPGTLDRVAEHAALWLSKFLPSFAPPPALNRDVSANP